MGLKGGKEKQGKGQYNGYCYQCRQWRDGKELRVVSNCVQLLWPKREAERENVRENAR